MPAPGTSFAGPLESGPRLNADSGGPANAGLVLLTQAMTLTQNGTTAVSGTFTIPEHCQILDFLVDNQIVWNSATSASLTIGTAAAGTQYATGMDVKAAVARFNAPVSPTAAQMAALKDTGTNKSVVVTVTPTGATTTGTTNITMRYIQTKAWM